MKINAYILAADPAWIPASIGSYYDIVERIVVTYDQNYTSWVGNKIDLEPVLEVLKKCDPHNKIEFRSGDFARLGEGFTPMQNETAQRQVALEWASEGADWVLQLDGDEVLPDNQGLIKVLQQIPDSVDGVEWPMRVLYAQVDESKFLEVCNTDKRSRFEYPGPIVVRPNVKFENARRVTSRYERVKVVGDTSSIQIQQNPGPLESRTQEIREEQAVIHFSWVRPRVEMRTKLNNWGHCSKSYKAKLSYLRWVSAPHLWRFYRDFHPFAHGLWPRLRLATIEWKKFCQLKNS